MKNIFLIFLIFSLFSIIPSIHAQVHPLDTIEIFDDENQSWCYVNDLLKDATINGVTDQTMLITNLMENLRTDFSARTNMDVGSLGQCTLPTFENVITAEADFENDVDVIAWVAPVDNFANQQKIIVLNTLNLDVVTSGLCIEGVEKSIIFDIAMTHELGHFAGLDHLKPEGTVSAQTIMSDRYMCQPTSLTVGDINQINSMYPNTAIVIPSWIKNNAEFWANNEIDDDTFLVSIQWLVQNGIVKLGHVEPGSPSDDRIPDWIKVAADAWVQDITSDAEFAAGLKWLIEHGVIQI